MNTSRRLLHGAPSAPSVTLTPRPDVVSTLVYAATHADVRTVVIDGRVVLRDGELLTLDEGEVRREAEAEAASLFERALKV